MSTTVLSHLREFFLSEDYRNRRHGGTGIPEKAINQFLYRFENDRDLSKTDFGRAVEEFLRPYELTIPFKWAEHCKKLRESLLKSSRFIRLRQRRGLPFKSKRQPS